VCIFFCVRACVRVRVRVCVYKREKESERRAVAVSKCVLFSAKLLSRDLFCRNKSLDQSSTKRDTLLK